MNPPALPKIVWMYWMQGEQHAPNLVRHCLRSWRLKNPGWDVRVLDAATCDAVTDGCLRDLHGRQDLDATHFSDLLRLALLARHGGVWADATVYCHRPLDAWLPACLDSGFFAFASPGPDRALSSWFLASVPGHLLIRRWQASLLHYWEHNRFRTSVPVSWMRRLEQRYGQNIATTRGWFRWPVCKLLRVTPYFAAHYLFNRLITEDAACRASWQRTPCRLADAPHRLQQLGLLAEAPEDLPAWFAVTDTPVFKLDRRVQDDLPGGCVLATLYAAAEVTAAYEAHVARA